MSSDNYRWIGTDRRSDAEILREIAGADTAMVIVSRDDPVELVEAAKRLLPRRKRQAFAGGVLLFPPVTDELNSALDLTKNWVTNLSLLVTPPSSFGVVCLSSLATQSISSHQSASLWEGILQADSDELPVVRSRLNYLMKKCQCLGDSVTRKLIPNPVRLPTVIRSRIEDLGGVYSTDEPDDIALKAGLFQWHDALHESHECSQSIEGQGRHRAGDYWHAIMHRREPDYGNSKYWFRHVGSHPIFPDLGRRAEPLIAAAAPQWRDRLLKNGWDPFAFVDFCELAATGNNPELTETAEKIQELEMLLLLASTYEDAAMK